MRLKGEIHNEKKPLSHLAFGSERLVANYLGSETVQSASIANESTSIRFLTATSNMIQQSLTQRYTTSFATRTVTFVDMFAELSWTNSGG